MPNGLSTGCNDHGDRGKRRLVARAVGVFQVEGERVDTADATEMARSSAATSKMAFGATLAKLDVMVADAYRLLSANDGTFKLYWLYPFSGRIHYWLLDEAGQRLGGWDLSADDAQEFLIQPVDEGPTYIITPFCYWPSEPKWRLNVRFLAK